MKHFFAFLSLMLVLTSCARVGSPIGGNKDTIPPMFLRSNIDSPRTNVSTNLKELRLYFDEYVKLKDVNKNLIVSPPVKRFTKIIPSNLANKYISIQWQDTLQANTTYNFNFGNAIVDNNEETPLPYFNFAFSTGEKIDDLYISGEAKKATVFNGDSNEKNFLVGLYKVSDSINFKTKPDYVTRADDDGYYELNYLSAGKYRLIAFNDINGNTIFDEGKEEIAFKKEDIDFKENISGLNVRLFPSKKQVKYKETKPITGGLLMLFEGHPKSVSVSPKSLKPEDFKAAHQPYSDSVRIWLNPKTVNIASTENLKFKYTTPAKTDSASVFYKSPAKDDMTISTMGENKLPPNQPLRITSNFILDKIDTSKWMLKSDSLTTETFKAQISETNPYQIIVESDFKEGKQYQLTVPKETVSSYFNSVKNPYRFDFERDKIENYGKVTFVLKNVPKSKYWIQLLDTSYKVIYSRYTQGSEVVFNILKPANYMVRMLVDSNENGFWDETDFKNQMEAEPVYTFYKIVNVRPLWDLVEDWDIADPKSLEIPKNFAPAKTDMDKAQENKKLKSKKPTLDPVETLK